MSSIDRRDFPWLPPSTIRKVRLRTGLVLFTYISAHLLNHSLGNFSLAWAEDGLLVHKFVWQSVIGTTVLYGAFILHFFLGLYALYERRMVHWAGSEIAQLLLGLMVPPLLATHLAGTRIAFAAYGIDKGYAQVLYSLWVMSPYIGLVQMVLLIVAWTHGCLGIGFWFRLQPWFARVRGSLLCAAVLLPVLALLGFLQLGREVVALARDPDWRAVALAPDRTGATTQNRWLADLRDDFLVFDGGAILLVLLARLVRVSLEQRGPRFTVTYPDGKQQTVPVGCGGRGRCTQTDPRIVVLDLGAGLRLLDLPIRIAARVHHASGDHLGLHRPRHDLQPGRGCRQRTASSRMMEDWGQLRCMVSVASSPRSGG